MHRLDLMPCPLYSLSSKKITLQCQLKPHKLLLATHVTVMSSRK